MSLTEPIIDEMVARFRARLVACGDAMRAANTPEEFCKREREIHALAREMGDACTTQILNAITQDAQRRKQAADDIRQRAAQKNINVRSEGTRNTDVRLLGGTLIQLRTSYMRAVPRGEGPRKRRGDKGTGVYPVLDQLGIQERATPALRLRVSHALCEASSVSAARELMAQAGLSVEHKTALRLTYATANVALNARKDAMQRLKKGVDGGEFSGRKIVASIDGGRLQVRKALRGRPPKGGRRKFRVDWREPKVLTVYVLGEDGKRDRSIPSIIDTTLGDCDSAFKLLLYHLRRVGAHEAEELVLIGDGAKWIWNRAEWLREELGLPAERFTEIVDYFHAVERLYAFARSRSGWSEKKVHRWVLQQKNRLKRGWIERIVSSMEPLLTASEQESGTELGYWTRNVERLRLKSFRDRGLPNGSGAVESAVRRVVNLRLKGPSVLWKEESAEGMLHLRAHAKAGRWHELEASVLENARWKPKARRPQRSS